MKKFWFLILCFICNHSFSYDLNHNYLIRVEKNNHIIFHNEISLKNTSSISIKEEDFIDNCIVYNKQLKNFVSTINNQLYSHIEKVDNDFYLKIYFSYNDFSQKIYLKDCFIEEPKVGEFSTKIMLPIFSYKENFKLNDKSFNKYSIIIDRRNIQ